MARSRNIKPAIMDNEKLAELSGLHRLLFIYLWMLADREGRLEDRPKRIAAQALPYDRSADVGAMLDDLQSVGFIVRYVVDGLACIFIPNFSKHQSPHVRESDSELPSPEQGTTKEVTKHNLGCAQASPRSPDSLFLIPDSLIPDMPQAKPATRQPKADKQRKAKMPPDFAISERVATWASKNGFGSLEAHLEAFKRKVEASGYMYINWDSAFMEAIREDWAKLRTPQRGNTSFAQQAADVARSTVPGRQGRDPVLVEFERHAKHGAAPIPENIRQQMEKLKGGVLQ